MKEIKLTQGQVALVDDQDFDYLNQFCWNAHYDKFSNGFYALGNIYIDDIPVKVSMHRLILNAKKGDIVDHIDHDTLNNKRDNIKICSKSENQRNISLRRSNNSGFTGVFYNKTIKKWDSTIGLYGKIKRLGQYIKKEDAIIARKEANIKYGFHDNHGKTFTKKTNINNHRYKKLMFTNKSGYPGVFFNSRDNIWESSIYLKSKKICLGGFKLKEDAIAAREKAEIQKAMKYHVEFI